MFINYTFQNNGASFMATGEYFPTANEDNDPVFVGTVQSCNGEVYVTVLSDGYAELRSDCAGLVTPEYARLCARLLEAAASFAENLSVHEASFTEAERTGRRAYLLNRPTEAIASRDSRKDDMVAVHARVDAAMEEWKARNGTHQNLIRKIKEAAANLS